MGYGGVYIVPLDTSQIPYPLDTLPHSDTLPRPSPSGYPTTLDTISPPEGTWDQWYPRESYIVLTLQNCLYVIFRLKFNSFLISSLTGVMSCPSIFPIFNLVFSRCVSHDNVGVEVKKTFNIARFKIRIWFSAALFCLNYVSKMSMLLCFKGMYCSKMHFIVFVHA